MTVDQGKELAFPQTISERTGTRVFFCDAPSPWQRGSNENMNGLLRDYFPKRTDLSGVTPGELQRVAGEITDRPRKTLDWARPARLLADAVQAPQGGRMTVVGACEPQKIDVGSVSSSARSSWTLMVGATRTYAWKRLWRSRQYSNHNPLDLTYRNLATGNRIHSDVSPASCCHGGRHSRIVRCRSATSTSTRISARTLTGTAPPQHPRHVRLRQTLHAGSLRLTPLRRSLESA